MYFYKTRNFFRDTSLSTLDFELLIEVVAKWMLTGQNWPLPHVLLTKMHDMRVLFSFCNLIGPVLNNYFYTKTVQFPGSKHSWVKITLPPSYYERTSQSHNAMGSMRS